MNKDDLKLYLVTDSTLSLGRPIEDVVACAVKGGVKVVQLREKTASTLDFYNLAVRLKNSLKETGVPLIINDRIDIALAVDADGIHIGQSDMPYDVARKILGKGKIIGLSCDNDEQLLAANNLDVDYVAVQAFGTTTKVDANHPIGLEGVKHARVLTKHPLVAIGGIHLKNAFDVSFAGADGIAVVSEIMSAQDPVKASNALLSEIENGIRCR